MGNTRKRLTVLRSFVLTCMVGALAVGGVYLLGEKRRVDVEDELAEKAGRVGSGEEVETAVDEPDEDFVNAARQHKTPVVILPGDNGRRW